MSIKKLLLCLLASCLVCGCSDKPDVPRKPADTLFLAFVSDPKTLNPILAAETTSTQVLGFLFEGLVKLDVHTAEIVPCLAQSWTCSDDNLTWTFKLHEDVRWSDGHEFTADDVVFTFESLIYNPDVPSSLASIFTVDGEKMIVEKVDKYTVRVRTPVPYAPFLYEMQTSILPRHILEPFVSSKTFMNAWGVDADVSTVVGTGPFMIESYLPGQRCVLSRNPYYRLKDKQGRQLPLINRVVGLIVQNPEVAVIKFRSGEIDIVGVSGKHYRPLFEEQSTGSYGLYDCGPGQTADFVTFNQSPELEAEEKKVWFCDREFRTAVAHAIDAQSMIDNIFFGQGERYYAAMSEYAGAFFNPDVARYDYDLDKARAILEKAGYMDTDGDGIIEKPAGVPVSFTLLTNTNNPLRMDMCAMIKTDLGKIGLDVSIAGIDFNTMITRLSDPKSGWEAALLGFTGVIEPHGGKNVWDPSGRLHFWNLSPAFSGGNEKTVNQWKASLPEWETEIESLFSRGVREFDREKRVAIYRRWQDIVARELPVIYMVGGKRIYAVSNRVKGVDPTPLGGVLHNIDELELLDG